MEGETLKDALKIFSAIDIEDEAGSETNAYACHPFENNYRPKPILRYIPRDYVDFEEYVKEKCQNKIQILNRETFRHIKKPIVIEFNHFREKCCYHTSWLDGLYQLALKYGERIEFIAADMIDIDVIYPGRNPINFFCRLVKPENESPKIYAIDEKKRIHEHFGAFEKEEPLSELCENLLNGNLFPQNNEANLVKFCVHSNFEELIVKSSKNIFLIVHLERYQKFEPSYEDVALALKDYNLDIVYMEAEKNYIPFEYQVNTYPTILFIPCNDKNNFVYYKDEREMNSIVDFLKNVLDHPEFLQLKQREHKSSILQKVVKVPNNFQMDYNKLPEFFYDNYNNRFQVLDRQVIEKLKTYSIVIFMDFPNMKCSAHHVEWLNKLYQFVEMSFNFQFFIADFKDIDIINTRWKPHDVMKSAQGQPKIYAIDRLKHTYEFGNFNSPSALYYFTEDLLRGRLYYSQIYEWQNRNETVKRYTADYFNVFLKKSKKHILITFYSSDDEKAERILNLVNQIADDINDLNIAIATFDVKFNFVDLEYTHDSYPVHYFIQKCNRRLNRFYSDSDLNKDKVLEFIKSNLAIN